MGSLNEAGETWDDDYGLDPRAPAPERGEREHSALPWRAYHEGNGAYCVAQDTGEIRGFGTSITGWGCVTQSKADAAFIVTACNSYERDQRVIGELVGALTVLLRGAIKALGGK